MRAIERIQSRSGSHWPREREEAAGQRALGGGRGGERMARWPALDMTGIAFPSYIIYGRIKELEALGQLSPEQENARFVPPTWTLEQLGILGIAMAFDFSLFLGCVLRKSATRARRAVVTVLGVVAGVQYWDALELVRLEEYLMEKRRRVVDVERLRMAVAATLVKRHATAPPEANGTSRLSLDATADQIPVKETKCMKRWCDVRKARRRQETSRGRAGKWQVRLQEEGASASAAVAESESRISSAWSRSLAGGVWEGRSQ
ncbi:Protein of unknown function [Gryllus bimaculatus]|nr:Protein of unknown function [Gryllus bimaculatus]